MALIRKWNRNDPIEADRLNELVDAVNAVRSIAAGSGLTARRGRDGVTLSLDWNQIENRGIAVFGRVTAVAGGAGPAIASTFTYEFTAFGRPDLPVYSGLTPTGGRPVRTSDTTTEIYPAPVDTWAILVLEPAGSRQTAPKLHLLVHEALALEDCGAAAVSEPNSVSLLSLLDHVLVDENGDIVVDANGRIVTDGWVNDNQNAEFMDPVIVDENGSIVVDADGNVVVATGASAACIALWDSVVVDANGDIVVDDEGNIVTEEPLAA